MADSLVLTKTVCVEILSLPGVSVFIMYLLFPDKWSNSVKKLLATLSKHLAVCEKADAAYHRNVERIRATFIVYQHTFPNTDLDHCLLLTDTNEIWFHIKNTILKACYL